MKLIEMLEKKKNIKGLILLVWLSIFIFQSPNSILCFEKRKEIQILVTSDIHGWLSTSLIYPTRKRKGLLHIADIIKKARQSNPELLLIDAGDLLQGSPLAHFFNHVAKPILDNPFFHIFQILNYDAVVVGNHDLAINPLLEEIYLPVSNFTWLAANVYRNSQLVFSPYKIVNRSGTKIAILGFTTPGSLMWNDSDKSESFTIHSISDAIYYWLKVLKKTEKPNVIIAVFHAGLDPFRDDENSKFKRIPSTNVSKRMLEDVEGVDLAIVGHDHRLNPTQKKRNISYIGKIPVVQAGRWAEVVLDVKLNWKGHNFGQISPDITVNVLPAIQNKQIDDEYKSSLPDAFKEYLFESLPLHFQNAPKKQLTKCINILNALAQDDTIIDGTMFPKIKIDRKRDVVNDDLRRIDLFRWIKYDNKSVTIKVNGKQISLLNSPKPEYGKRKARSNRVLFPWFKIDLERGNSYFGGLNKHHFKKNKLIKISNYHNNGGGGIIPQIFLQQADILEKSNEFLRDNLYEYLKSCNHSWPDECQFLVHQCD